MYHLSGCGGGGIKSKRKRTHGHRQQCGDCRRVGLGRGLVEVKKGIKAINGNGKIQ